ncbi:MAG: dihydroneopterin aldolase [Candidatus Thalassarchaeaceae archaeon]
MSKTTPHLTSIISRIDTSGWTTILLEDVVMQLDIGAHDFEKGVKQPIRFDIEVMLEGAESPTRDEIDEVLDYEYLHNSIESAISKRHSLLETLAASILDEILLPEKAVAGVVCLTKLSPTGFEGKFGCSMAKVKPGRMT